MLLSEQTPDRAEIEQYPEADFYQKLALYLGDFKDIDPATMADEDISRIINDLDSICPYIHVPVAVKGTGWVPIIKEGQPLDEAWASVENYVGLHCGVNVSFGKATANGRPPLKIFHQIMIYEAAGFQQRTKFSHEQLFALIDVDESEVFPLQSIDEAYVDHSFDLDEHDDIESVNRALSVLWGRGRQLDEMLSSSAFADQSRRQEHRFLRRFVLDASRQSPVSGLPVDLDGCVRGHSVVHSKDGSQQVTTKLDISKFSVEGVCLGVELLNWGRVSNGQEYRYSDLPAGKRGLCLVVDPTEAVRDHYKLGKQQVLYIPMVNNGLDDPWETKET